MLRGPAALEAVPPHVLLGADVVLHLQGQWKMAYFSPPDLLSKENSWSKVGWHHMLGTGDQKTMP